MADKNMTNEGKEFIVEGDAIIADEKEKSERKDSTRWGPAAGNFNVFRISVVQKELFRSDRHIGIPDLHRHPGGDAPG
ncbi:MAG: hypothetical protein HQK66_15450, partial [Desulfamplus sp.]|nr:hypothetical protein [Desulfamplus sp.]